MEDREARKILATFAETRPITTQPQQFGLTKKAIVKLKKGRQLLRRELVGRLSMSNMPLPPVAHRQDSKLVATVRLNLASVADGKRIDQW